MRPSCRFVCTGWKMFRLPLVPKMIALTRGCQLSVEANCNVKFGEEGIQELKEPRGSLTPVPWLQVTMFIVYLTQMFPKKFCPAGNQKTLSSFYLRPTVKHQTHKTHKHIKHKHMIAKPLASWFTFHDGEQQPWLLEQTLHGLFHCHNCDCQRYRQPNVVADKAPKYVCNFKVPFDIISLKQVGNLADLA